MSETKALTLRLLEKVEQQIELAIELLARVPGDRLEWQPAANTFRLSQLLGHLLEAAAGFCAALYRFKTQELADFEQLRALPVNHDCDGEAAVARLRDYLAHIRRGFAVLDDGDLARCWPTAFAPAGEAALTILLTNLEHFINHKHQLFFYLKLLGVEVGTAQLYKIKTPPAT